MKTPRVVLITGASSGIGRACALRLARRGDVVFGTTRRPPETVEDELRAMLPESVEIHVLYVDVNSDTSVMDAVQTVVRQTGRLDVVVNCAGIGIAGALEETSEEEAWGILNTNLLGVLRVCRAALPFLRQQNRGIILNISSIGGRIGLPFQGAYSATKFALEGLTEALRMEVRPYGIRAVLIEPGDFHTQFTDRRQIVQASTPVSGYRAAQDRVLAVVEKDERSGADPEAVARLVERLAKHRSPRVRYTVGPASQRMAAGLKRILPSKWFELALSHYYSLRPDTRRRI